MPATDHHDIEVSRHDRYRLPSARHEARASCERAVANGHANGEERA
jgi:hypothetical protein